MFDEYIYKLNYLYSVEPSITITGSTSPDILRQIIFYIKDTFESIDDSFNFGHVEVAKILEKLYGFEVIEDNEFYQVEEEYDINDFNNCLESEYEQYKRYFVFNKQFLHNDEIIKEVWRLIQREDIASYADVHEILTNRSNFNKIGTYISDGNCTICNLDRVTVEALHNKIKKTTIFAFNQGYNLIIRDISNISFSMQNGLLQIGLLTESPDIKPILIEVKPYKKTKMEE